MPPPQNDKNEQDLQSKIQEIMVFSQYDPDTFVRLGDVIDNNSIKNIENFIEEDRVQTREKAIRECLEIVSKFDDKEYVIEDLKSLLPPNKA